VVCGSLQEFHSHQISSLIKQSKWRSDVWRKRWIIEQVKRLISEQVKARWISEQVKARWMLHALVQWASEGAMDVTMCWINEQVKARLISEQVKARLISEQVKARWISEQTKALWMLHVFDQCASI
jgi:hypothetical protein